MANKSNSILALLTALATCNRNDSECMEHILFLYQGGRSVRDGENGSNIRLSLNSIDRAIAMRSLS